MAQNEKTAGDAPASTRPSATPPLAWHGALLALPVFVAVHDSPEWAGGWAWARGWLFALFALLNAAAYFGYTRRRAGGPSVADTFRRVPPLVWVPVLYFGVLGLLYSLQLGVPLGVWAVHAAGYALTFLTAADLFARTGDARPALAGLCAAGVAVCAEGLARMALGGGLPEAFARPALLTGFQADSPALFGFGVGYPNALASLLILWGALALGLAATAPKAAGRGLWYGVFGLFGACAALTGSRGGVPFFLLTALAWAGRKRGPGRNLALGGALALSGGVLLWLLRSAGGILRGDHSLKTRFHMAFAALAAAKPNPVFGGGPTAFREKWAAYGAGKGYTARYGAPDSLPFALIAEGGLLMLAMAAALVTGCLLELRALLRSSLRPATRELLLAFALGLSGVLLHSLLESAFRAPAFYLATAVFLGLLVGLRRRVEM